MADKLFAFNLTADADFDVYLIGALDRIGTTLDSFYPCEESGGTRFDVTVNTDDLTEVGTIGNATGKIGNAADLERANSEHLIAAASSVHDFGDEDFTIAGWFQLDDKPVAAQSIHSKWTAFGDQRQYLLQYGGSGIDRFRWLINSSGAGAGTAIVTANNFGSPTAGVLVFIVVWHDSVANTTNIQINDGTPDSLAHSAGVFQGSAKFGLGFFGRASDGAPDDFQDGLSDEVAVFSSVLTAAQKTAMYAGGAGRNLQDFFIKDFAFAFQADADFALALDGGRQLELAFQADADFAVNIERSKLLAFSLTADADFAVEVDVELSFKIDVAVDANFQIDFFTTNVQAFDDDLMGLRDQMGEGADRLQVSGISANITSPPQWQAETLIDLQTTIDQDLADVVPTAAAPASATVNHAFELDVSLASDWFGKVYIIPQSIDAGLVLTDLAIPMEIYSSFLTASIDLDSATNNVGVGVSLGGGFPGLPNTFLPQTGITFTMDIARLGPPEFAGTFDFVFDIPQTILVPVSGTRTRLFSVEPERRIIERLVFESDVMRRLDETEQRRALRLVPRQEIDYRYRLDGLERQMFESLVFDGQGRFFGLPIWWEPQQLTAPITAGDTILNVDSTAFGDFRVGGLIAVWEDVRTFEVLEILSLTTTTITVTTEVDADHPIVKTRILPVRVASMASRVGGTKRRRNVQDTRVAWTVLDNDVDLADTSAFPTFDGKVLLDEPNMMQDSLRDNLMRRITVIDNIVGQFDVVAEANVSRRIHPKAFFSTTRQRLWEIRLLLHAIKGRATSFWIPTFYDDVTPVIPIGSSDSSLDIDNLGYTLLIQSRAPRNTIRLLLKDGTAVILGVLSSTEISSTVERLTLDGSWGIDATLDEIDRVEFLTKVRMNSDEAEIRHENARGQAVVTIPLIEVLE